MIALLAACTLWHPHPLMAHTCRVQAGWYGDPARADIAHKLRLYEKALTRDEPLRQGVFTAYHPHEWRTGGGETTAESDSLLLADGRTGRTDIAASALRHYRRNERWKNAQLWIEGWGLVKVRDNGPGWTDPNQFDLCQRSVSDVHRFGKQRRRFVVLSKGGD